MLYYRRLQRIAPLVVMSSGPLLSSIQCSMQRLHPVSGTLRRSNLIREQKRRRGTWSKCNQQRGTWSLYIIGADPGVCGAFTLARGCKVNLISDLRLPWAVFEKERLEHPPPSDGLMRPYLSLITILPTQGRSSREAVHVHHRKFV